MQEEWMAVVGYEGLYEVSNLGRVVSLKRFGQNALRHSKAVMVEKGGYHRMLLWKHGHGRTKMVHRLVAEAFIGPCPPEMVVNHIDGDKANNAATNLQYVTFAANSRHAVDLGLTLRGERARSAVLTEQQVREIRALKGTISGIKLAERYGLSRSATYAVLWGKTWKHVV